MRFQKLKTDILGRDYSLSIAYVSEEQSQELNKKYRNKNNPTNVLSFALSKNSGELILCTSVIKKEAKNKKFGKNFADLSLFLVIHGMLHLKGMKHGATMEEAEELYFKKYDKKHRSGNRHGVRNDASRGRRISSGRKNS